MTTQEQIEDLQFDLEEAQAELRAVMDRRCPDPEDVAWAVRAIDDLREQLAELRAETEDA